MPDPAVVNATVRWAQEFETATGRPPNIAEAAAFTTQYAVRHQVDPEMATLKRTALEREATAVQSAADHEFEALKEQYPEAATPGVEEAVGKYLVRQIGNTGRYESGDVKKAFWALFGEQIADRRTKGQQAARTAQGKRARTAPSVAPPAPAPEEKGPPPSTNFDEIAERQRRNPKHRKALRDLLHSRSDR